MNAAQVKRLVMYDLNNNVRMRPLRSIVFIAIAVQWIPTCTANVTSRIPSNEDGGGSCDRDWDCSLAGVCEAGACSCDAWATGPHCQLLNFVKPKDPTTHGLQMGGYYSWGGHAAYYPASKRYQGYFSFMCQHKTLSAWTTDSSIVRATSRNAVGPYTVQDMVVQPWAHNTMLVRDPSADKHLLFFIGTASAPSKDWKPCISGSSQPEMHKNGGNTTVGNPANDASQHANNDAGPAADPPHPGDVSAATAPSLSSNNWTVFRWPNGSAGNNPSINFTQPWDARGVAGNPAPYIFENGTTLLYYSAQPCPPQWGVEPTCISVARADHWTGPYTTVGRLPITRPESEDPFVFRDQRGNFHLLTNVNNGHKRCGQGVACGGHAWSEDGLSFSDLVIGAFGPQIPLANGSTWVNAYLERPQVMLNADGIPTTFFGGLGRSSYSDSCTWAQALCTVKGDPNCAPTGKVCAWNTHPNGAFNYTCPE
eukprot:m.62073 g.62073  ORF g.62073 m.62073 type:complete len:480 (-) comp15790_c0_seq2:80-1519(-)